MTGSASVMPYGVCNSAFGISAWTRRSSVTGTGAPADNTVRTPASAERCSEPSRSAVSTTLRRAAGEAKITVASTACTASARAVAVRVAGRVTSMSGTAAAMPSAGPYRANGAKAATSRSSGPIRITARTWSSWARS